MCEFCDLKPFETNCYAGISKIYIGKPIMDVSYWANIRIIKIYGEFRLKVSGERYENTRIIKYCPICGKKLK